MHHWLHRKSNQKASQEIRICFSSFVRCYFLWDLFANLLRKVRQLPNYPDSDILLFFLSKWLSMLIAKHLCTISDGKEAYLQAGLLVPTGDCLTPLGKLYVFWPLWWHNSHVLQRKQGSPVWYQGCVGGFSGSLPSQSCCSTPAASDNFFKSFPKGFLNCLCQSRLHMKPTSVPWGLISFLLFFFFQQICVSWSIWNIKSLLDPS